MLNTAKAAEKMFIFRKGGRGFTLIELTIVTVIIGLLFAMLMPVTSTVLNNQKRKTTALKLANIEAALTNFALINRRLPCPADGFVNTGVEGGRDVNGDCASNPSNQANGVVPWTAIGLALTDIVDGWENRVTYRVAYGLTRTSALDMSACDTAGTNITPALPGGAPLPISTLPCQVCSSPFVSANCTPPNHFLAQKGLNISDGAALVMDYTALTGAAYVLISHGQNGYGAITATGVYLPQPISGIAGTTLENPNRNLPGLTIGNSTPPTFIDAAYSDNENSSTTYFDDLVIRPTLMSVIGKAQLGPRSH